MLEKDGSTLVSGGSLGGEIVATYNVMIVDDELTHVQAVLGLLDQSADKGRLNVEFCTSLEELENRLVRGYVPNIVFMDIVFSDDGASSHVGEGIEAARRICSGCPGVQLIYMSGYSEYCTRVYQTDHIYFLLKPLNRTDFDEALKKAIRNLDERSMRPFGVKVGGRIVRVVPSEIEYIESDRRKVRIFSGEECLEAYESLSGIMQKLPKSFVQCHKSFLVNMNKIVEMRSDVVIMNSGASVPVSQKRSRDARIAFTQYLLERM